MTAFSGFGDHIERNEDDGIICQSSYELFSSMPDIISHLKRLSDKNTRGYPVRRSPNSASHYFAVYLSKGPLGPTKPNAAKEEANKVVRRLHAKRGQVASAQRSRRAIGRLQTWMLVIALINKSRDYIQCAHE
ncbi:unnamed protein product, partial [Ixodes pacificus]